LVKNHVHDDEEGKTATNKGRETWVSNKKRSWGRKKDKGGAQCVGRSLNKEMDVTKKA